MSGLIMEWRKRWLCPRDSHPKTFEQVVENIKKYNKFSVYVGCDSHTAKGHEDKYLFAIAICVLSDEGNTYFYCRGVHSKKFNSLQGRLTEEVALSADVATQLMKFFPKQKITLHADSNTDSKHRSSKFTELFKNWALGIGCDFASKPDAWASSSIADKHSK